MYTVDDTYYHIGSTTENQLVCDKTFHRPEGEIRVICWSEIAAVHSKDEPIYCVRSWANSVWNDTQFSATLERATILIDAFEYGV